VSERLAQEGEGRGGTPRARSVVVFFSSSFANRNGGGEKKRTVQGEVRIDHSEEDQIREGKKKKRGEQHRNDQRNSFIPTSLAKIESKREHRHQQQPGRGEEKKGLQGPRFPVFLAANRGGKKGRIQKEVCVLIND